MIKAQEHDVHFQGGNGRNSSVTVIITVYNYASVVEEALESVFRQTYDSLSIVIVEDHGSDSSLSVCRDWLSANSSRFGKALLVRHRSNCGLSSARNTAFFLSQTPYVFVLDADNKLYPRCIEHCHGFLHNGPAVFSYPIIDKFGDETGLIGTEVFCKELLSDGNVIDAMALIRKAAWKSVGGYSIELDTGWEDYDLWCRFAAHGWYGVRVPMILARYRVHDSSMLRTLTDKPKNLEYMMNKMRARHPWLKFHER